MDKNQLRLALAGVAAFYVIIGGLFLQAYIPVARFEAFVTADSEPGVPSREYSIQEINDGISYDANLAKAGRYGAILLWGTLGFATFGGAVFLMQRKRPSEPPTTN